MERLTGKGRMLVAFLGLALLFLPAPVEASARIKELAFVSGVRSNQLVGYGLVAGLDGTGDGRRVPFTTQMLSNMVNQFGVSFDPRQLRAENVATVIVTAELPPYAREGTRIDATVSTIGAESLQGGTLMLTALQGADGQIYALAQGPVSVGGFATRARRAGQEKHLAAGVIVGGAIVEREVPSTILSDGDQLTLCLKRADFTTAKRVEEAINLRFHQLCAEAVDGGTLKVKVPMKYRNDVVTFISEMELVPVEADVISKVIMNERTGTVVVGQDAVITPVAISHGGIRIIIGPSADDAADAETTEGHLAEISGANVGEVAAALNELGVTPQDMIAIFQALERAGSLQGQLELM